MKKIFNLIFIIGLVFCFSVNVSAHSSSQNVRSTVHTLMQSDVSPGWQNDIQSNRAYIQSIDDAVQNMSADELSELYDIQQEIIGYIGGLYELDGKDTSALPDLFKNISPVSDAGKSANARQKALDIYNNLINSGVSYTWELDIAKNRALIEEMLIFTYSYTPEELNEVTFEERIGMMNYFKALYSYLDYDVLTLETILSAASQPLTEGIVPTTAQIGTDIKRNFANKALIAPAPESIPNLQGDYSRKNIDTIASTALACVICIGVAGLLVIFIKKRDEQKHPRY